MKKVSILFVVLLLPLIAFADAVEIGGIFYNLVEKAKIAEVSNNPNKYKGDIVIPESVEYNEETYSVTSIGKSAFSNSSGIKELKSITIPKTITSIASMAFFGSGVSSIKITDLHAWCEISFADSYSNPLSSGSNSSGVDFYLNNELIKNLRIPNTVTYISNYAFCGGRFETIIIPSSVTSIGDNAFQNCKQLINLNIPEGTTIIGKFAFDLCSNLTNVVLSPVKTIQLGAFWRCSSLKSITLGKDISYIDSKSFADCSQLEEVYCYSQEVPYIHQQAFENSMIEYATLYVPAASLEKYKGMNFKNVVALNDGDTPEIQKCSKPIIIYNNGRVSFSCDTDGVEFVSEITAPDAKKYNDSTICLNSIYIISVYAKREGYDNSETITAEIVVEGDLRGDLNGDGEVNVTDHVELTKIILGH